MNRRVWALGAVLLGLVGCAHQQTRLQSEDDSDRDREAKVKIIGDVAGFDNVDPIPVSGVGLVVGLEGTGGGAPPGSFRTMLETQLRKRKIDNVKDILSSPNTSLVLVSALVPAGARDGDPIDVEVTLPPESKTTSLRGGRLVECLLYNYDSAGRMDPNYRLHAPGTDKTLIGHPLARAEGPLLVGFGDGDEAARLRQGRIWGGGRCKLGRPFYLVLNNDQQYYRVAMRAAERINETFQGPFQGVQTMAEAKTKQAIVLNVPHQYRHNLPRYLRVVRLIPLQEAPAVGSPYRRRLEEELLDPAHTVTAALRLEALGSSSIPALKRGLQSDHVLVRFTSAESLAYLGSPACGEELARLVQDQPVLRSYCLTALASLDEAVCHVKLNELLSSPSAETRYGAFRALRVLDERDPKVQGELLNGSFWVHQVAPDSSSLVHVSTSRRAEIVLFGEDVLLQPPFAFMAGPEFTVTAGNGDDRCTIRRFSLQRCSRPRQCSLKLHDVLRTLAELGGTYPDAVELLRQTEQCKCLSCRVAVDALPQATSVYTLARAGASDPEFLETDAEIIEARADFGATPTLFERGAGQRSRSTLDKLTGSGDEAALREPKPKNDAAGQRANVAPWRGHLLH